MAYTNIDQAVTIPQNQQLAGFSQQLYAQNQRNQALRLRQEEEQRQQQDALVKYVGSEFADKNYMTGSAYDPVINKQLADIRQKYAGMLQKPGFNMADVQFLMQKDLSDMTSLSSNIKALRTNVDQQVKSYEKFPGIDANALRQVALTNAFYKTDPKTGQRVLKASTELDPSEDYIQSVIRENPDLVAKGDQGLRTQLKAFQPQSTGDAVTKEVKGVTTEHKYTAKLPPYMQLVKDANGIATGVEVRGEELPNFKNPDGSAIKVADQDTYQTFITNPAAAVALNSMFKNWNSSQKTKIDPSSDEADIVRRKLLYDYLGKNAVYEFKPESKVTNNSLRDKLDFGLPLQSYRSGLSDAAKLFKEDSKLRQADPALILRAMGGDQTVLEGAPTKEVNGKTYYDIAASIGGIKLGYDKERKPVYATELLVDPISKELVRTGSDGSTQAYSGKDIRAFIKRTAEYNGITLDKADKMVNMYTDQQGNYKGNNGDLAALQAQQDLQRMSAKKALQTTADQFVSSKDLNQLEAVKGKALKNGAEIKDFGERGAIKRGLGMAQYYITLKDGTTKDFKTPFLLADYLKNNLK